jgi:hypothetical protein
MTDTDALQELGLYESSVVCNNFGIFGGVIYPKFKYQPTPKEYELIQFLCEDCDYAYDPDFDEVNE